ncbi:putative oxidoreductase [Flavobacterium araucananum]|uniref:Short-chain dehydrogenase n=1 Tax=Flavobacterium araucananum TaxID=946678 RepID=A0A227PC94_9FLAO|nr:SDR family NAD(P)-dependent oxidoreductase [Flavobacterium araucananum]OXG07103.1 short-chain dehydrogenase [Flavobacterium araucananum]PWK01361.1 putative oxidoreductase [Flavobacterium araucananum]
MNIQGKTILITGGASGIGLEAAKQFLTIGAKVIITGRNQAKLDAVKKAYPAITVIQSDVANNEDAKFLFSKVKELGGIDILYNNAAVLVPPSNLGIANDKHTDGAAYEIEVNYLGVVRLNNLFMNMLQSRKEAAIINTTSILSQAPSLLEATYSSSKTALAFYTISLREHLKIMGSNIKIFELIPPLVATQMTTDRNDKKISVEEMVKGLITGLEKEHYTIRVGDAKLFNLINRLFPKTAYKLINPKKSYQLLKN